MSDFRFNEAVAVVTGGAGGIGQAIATQLSQEGCQVAVVDLHLDAALLVADGIPNAIGLAADVGDMQSVAAMVDEVERRLGPIDIYCSNAGVATGGGLGDDADWDVSWRVHALAHVHAARTAVPGMVDRGSGAVVITASAAGLLMMLHSAAYSVTKHASVALAEWLAVTYGDSGVQFHCLCPLGVRTPMVSASEDGEAEASASGTIIEPADVAASVIDALRSNRFLVLPHPQVHEFEEARVADRDRWLSGLRRLRSRIESQSATRGP